METFDSNNISTPGSTPTSFMIEDLDSHLPAAFYRVGAELAP